MSEHINSANEVFSFLAGIDNRARRDAAGIPRSEEIQETWECIGFRLDGVRMLVDLESVHEVLTMPSISRVPGVKPYVWGIANVRGTLLPIIDAKAWFTALPTQLGPKTRVLVIDRPDVAVGVLVDEMLGVKHMPVKKRKNEQVPDERWLKKWSSHSFTQDGHELWDLDLDKLLAESTLLEFSL